MNRKFSIFIICILLIIGGGVFWWWQSGRKALPEYQEGVKWSEGIKYPSEREFIIKDTPEGKIVENMKAGLKIKVPKGWKAEKVQVGWDDIAGKPTDEWIVNLTSPDAKSDERNFLKKGDSSSVFLIAGNW